MTWTRISDARGDGYETTGAQIWDNGPGVGPTKGGGRWAVIVDGEWRANMDTLAEAKLLVAFTLRDPDGKVKS